MYIPNYPEDSTLRRHVDSAAAFRLEAFLAEGPSDSTLRRHFEQLRNASVQTAAPQPSTSETASMQTDAPTMAPPAPQTDAATTPSPAEQTDAPTTLPPAARKTGFMGWLIRWIGG